MALMELDHFGGSDGSSPHSGEYSSDSASSSSGDHSSPSEFTSPAGLIYDVGGMMVQPWPTTIEPAFGQFNFQPPPAGPNGVNAVKGPTDEFEHTHPQQPQSQPHAALSLPHDFWPNSIDSHAQHPHLALGRVVGLGADGEEGYGSYEHSMFDAMIHDSQCAPSTIPSPEPEPEGHGHYERAHEAYAADYTGRAQNLFSHGLSEPLDLAAVNAGIAPRLMGGQPTPPADVPSQPQQPPSQQTQPPNQTASITIPATFSDLPLASTSTSPKAARSSSLGKKRGADEAARNDPLDGASTSGSAAASVSGAPTSGGPTSLVAKDAVVASSVISSLITPAKVGGPSGEFKLMVLGVPAVGAKSRVETQIKISLVLIAPKPQRRVKSENGSGLDVGALTTVDGGLDPRAAEEVDRVGSWSHLRLPHYLALKKKTKKQAKADPPQEDTLSLDVRVVRGTDDSDEIFICSGCQARERKRALRKKEARVRPTADIIEGPINEEEEKRKVVVFNCAEFVEFDGGETILPTRITCYCRHHKEKKGFSVAFALRNSAGQVIASGATPPIMITDDHKTSSTRPGAADLSLDSIDPSSVGPSTAAATPAGGAPLSRSTTQQSENAMEVESLSSSSKPKRAKPAKKEKPAKASLRESVGSNASAGRPKRGTSRGKAGRGQADSGEEEEEIKAGKKVKPYDRKQGRPSNVHRSPSFAMTPLQPAGRSSGSPRSGSQAQASLAPSPMAHSLFESLGAQARTAQTDEWESALGLGGMTDHLMRDHNDLSQAPSPGAAHDWRSSASSPPLSPGSATTADTFQSFLNTLSSPEMSRSNAHSIASPPPDNRFGPAFDVQDPQNFALNAGPNSLPWTFGQSGAANAPPPPRISRLIPGEGPVHGGIEVTVLGENFVRDLVCVFGDSPAVPTHYWSSNTLVCILPPAANPGPVVVGIKGVPLTVEQGNGLQLFTYKDDSDRSLLELALQVVGLKMTGRLEDASAVAMRIVGNGNNGAGAPAAGGSTVSPGQTTNASTRGSEPHQLAQSLSAAASSAGAFPFVGGETRNFEGIVIKFLSLLDLDPSEIPGAAPSIPLARPAISHLNAQRHSLLHLAAVLGFHRLAQFLLARGISINSQDQNGYTALHFAALYGRVAITRMLLEAGAKAFVTNLAGKTAIDIARERDDVDVEEALLRYRTASPASPASRRQSIVELPSPATSSYPSSAADSEYLQGDSAEDVPGWSSSFSEEEDDSDDYSSADDDDLSWHSSDYDEESEYASSDVERRISRNASVVSLHYLLEAERDDIDDEVESIADAQPVTDDEIDRLDEKRSKEEHPSTPINHLAWATSAWLGKALKPVVPLNKLPVTSQVSNVWEKARSGGFALPPLAMPELTAFPSMANMPAFSKSWRGAHKAESGEEPVTESDGEATVVASSPDIRGDKRDWRALYAGPWWHGAKATPFSPRTPPPMYSPNEAATPRASTSPLPPPPAGVGAAGAGPATLQARIQRRVGYPTSDVSDSVVQSYLHHEKKMRRLREDKMLFFFWIPVLLMAIGFAVYSTWGPLSAFILDAVLPPQFVKMIRA